MAGAEWVQAKCCVVAERLIGLPRADLCAAVVVDQSNMTDRHGLKLPDVINNWTSLCFST